MTNFIKNFVKDEDGAVTVDWVVLTAAIVGLGIAAITSVSGGVNSLGEAISADLQSTDRVGAGVSSGSGGSTTP